MENWQWGLALLVGAWALQSVGTWKQMGHYRRVMGDITRRWPDGWLGVGNARGGLRKGVIAVVVVTPDDIVRRVLLMEGRSVFATFIELDGVAGLGVDDLVSSPLVTARAGRKAAVEMAVAQIVKAKTRAEGQQARTEEALGASVGRASEPYLGLATAAV